MTLNDGQIEELVRLAETQSAKALVAYVRRLLTAERAAVVAECAIRCVYLGAQWRKGLDAKHLDDYPRGRVHAYDEAAEQIRKLGEKRE